MIQKLIRGDRGATTVEVAFVLPVLILFIYGIFILGTVFQANAGMQHALGEGARLASLFPYPGNNVVQARMDAKFFSSPGGVYASSVTDGAGASGCRQPAGSNYKTLRITYTMPVNFIFFSAPSLNLARCKTVYTAS